MNQDFVVSLLVFTIVMVIFNIIKDILILPHFNISSNTKRKITKRWYISYVIGVILLLLMYGRDGPL